MARQLSKPGRGKAKGRTGPPPTDVEKLTYSFNKARAALGCGRAALRELLDGGVIPSFRRGNREVILKADVADHLRALTRRQRR